MRKGPPIRFSKENPPILLPKDVERELELSHDECLRNMESAATLGAKRAWYYTHLGEIEMCFNLRLISDKVNTWLHDEWREHRPEEGTL